MAGRRDGKADPQIGQLLPLTVIWENMPSVTALSPTVRKVGRMRLNRLNGFTDIIL